jgi:hypothetical protein
VVPPVFAAVFCFERTYYDQKNIKKAAEMGLIYFSLEIFLYRLNIKRLNRPLQLKAHKSLVNRL